MDAPSPLYLFVLQNIADFFYAAGKMEVNE